MIIKYKNGYLNICESESLLQRIKENDKCYYYCFNFPKEGLYLVTHATSNLNLKINSFAIKDDDIIITNDNINSKLFKNIY